ncbi:MAG TPA: hypothetical protein VGO00_30525 [Kofleriaceae bacterium]|nr:hypothetical protein [Kofleriaceae bacterium]
MNRVYLALASLLLAAPAVADSKKPPPTPPPPLPKVGDSFRDHAGWPALDYLYEGPSASDAAGKVVLHWFCSPKTQACVDDLARVVTLKENSSVYVIAYINGTKAEAQKLDPIRGSEGVGRGTVAYGKGVTTLMKGFSIIPGPMSIVEDADGKIAFESTSGDPSQLDARDAKVNDLQKGMRTFVSISDGPAAVKAGEKFQLALSIKLATYLKYTAGPAEFKLTAPSDIKCDSNTIRRDQMKIEGRMMVATVNCTATKGVYEARGDIRFEYTTTTGGTGIGNETTKWKFTVN